MRDCTPKDENRSWTPSPGDVYAVPLLNGKFGAMVLIEVGDQFRFLVLDGFWESLPTYKDASAKGFMAMYETHESGVFKGWFRQPFPENFLQLGCVTFATGELNAHLASSGTMVFGTAANFVHTLSERWRWRFDREALLKELELQHTAFEEKQRKRRASRSLETMLRERPFAHWIEQWPRSTVNKAHRIVREATKQLIDLRSVAGAETQMTDILKRVVDQFNELYAETGCIETQEAEEIVDWVQQLASRVGMSNENEQLTGHRIW